MKLLYLLPFYLPYLVLRLKWQSRNLLLTNCSVLIAGTYGIEITTNTPILTINRQSWSPYHTNGQPSENNIAQLHSSFHPLSFHPPPTHQLTRFHDCFVWLGVWLTGRLENASKLKGLPRARTHHLCGSQSRCSI